MFIKCKIQLCLIVQSQVKFHQVIEKQIASQLGPARRKMEGFNLMTPTVVIYSQLKFFSMDPANRLDMQRQKEMKEKRRQKIIELVEGDDEMKLRKLEIVAQRHYLRT
jgi:hypothetical protein